MQGQFRQKRTPPNLVRDRLGGARRHTADVSRLWPAAAALVSNQRTRPGSHLQSAAPEQLDANRTKTLLPLDARCVPIADPAGLPAAVVVEAVRLSESANRERPAWPARATLATAGCSLLGSQGLFRFVSCLDSRGPLEWGKNVHTLFNGIDSR